MTHEIGSEKHRLLPRDLLAFLASLGVEEKTVEHRPVFTVSEGADIKARIAGAHSKNLFVKDKKGRLFLITAKDHTPINLKRAHEAIGASGRLSFCSAEQLMRYLGVEPGSVTPFGVANDRDCKVKVILDAHLMAHEHVNFHPLVNSMTTTVSRDGLLIFLRATGHEPEILTLPVPPEDGGEKAG